MTEPLVSVVTPVYNGAEFIGECIDSVLAQTYRNWEYIVVDNCSTDRTLEIVRDYAKRDSRIRVEAPAEFVRASDNANRALRLIAPSSVYTKIVHADDWLFPECIERMVALSTANPNVGLVSAYRLEGNLVSLDGLPYEITTLPGRAVASSALTGRPYPYMFGSPTCLLIRSDLVRARDPFYNVANQYQDDYEAALEVLRDSDFGFVHQVLTFTRRHPDAASTYFSRVSAQLPSQIDVYRRFGQVFLERPVYERHLAVLVGRYVLFLVRNVTRLRSRAFRTYHRQAAAKLIRQLDWADVRTGIRIQAGRMWALRTLHTGGR
jgi:glycosyltransferase involved in cell wall biosynthesis